MDISLRISQLESGRAQHILLNGHVAVPYLMDTWLTNMRKFWGTHNFQIEISDACSPGIQCHQDSIIMQILAERGLSKHRLFHLNTCRTYLQVSSVADIATADGKKLRPEILNFERIIHRTIKWEWHDQLRDQQQQDWKLVMRRYFLTYGSEGKLRLRKPVG